MLLPVYNGADTIAASIRGILAQTHKEFELLVVDDGSNDNTAELVRRFTDSRVRLLHKENGGLGSALNVGLQHASADWIARIDADDYAHPLRLERQLAWLRKYPGCGVLGTWYAMHNGSSVLYIVHTETEPAALRRRFALHNEINHSSVIYRKDLVLAAGGYAAGVFEDYDLWLRLKDTAEFRVLPEPLVLTHYRPNSLSRSSLTVKNQKVYQLLEPWYRGGLEKEFGIAGEAEQRAVKGWREYFFGSRQLARAYWQPLLGTPLATPRLLLAYGAAHLPQEALTLLKEARIKFRAEYALQYLRPASAETRRLFACYLRDLALPLPGTAA